MSCGLCYGTGRTPIPRGMSAGFYGFMGAGCMTRDDGAKLMTCPRRGGTGKEAQDARGAGERGGGE